MSRRPQLQLRFGGVLGQLADSRGRIVASAVVAFVGAGALEYGSHTVASDAQISREAQTLLDSGLMGVLTAVLVALVLAGVRARRSLVYEQIQRVAELNHHVRNALEVIVSSTYLVKPENMAAVLASAEKIENTLRDLFPSVGEHGILDRTSETNSHSATARKGTPGESLQ